MCSLVAVALVVPLVVAVAAAVVRCCCEVVPAASEFRRELPFPDSQRREFRRQYLLLIRR